MTKTINTSRRVRRILLRVFTVLIVLIFVSVLYLSTVGLPNWLSSKLLGIINAGSFTLSTGTIKLDPFHGFVVDKALLYRKGVIGPAAVDAARVVLMIDPKAIIKKRDWIKRIKVSEGILRPRMAFGKEALSTAESKIKMDVRLELDRCEMQGLYIQKLSCDLQVDSPVMKFNNAKGILGRDDLQGPLTGSAVYNMDTCILDGQITTHFDPHLAIPILKDWDMTVQAEVVESFTFDKELPKCKADFQKLCRSDGFFTLNGQFELKDCTYNGVKMLHGDGRVSLDLSTTNSMMIINPLFVFREEGHVKTGLTVDFTRQLIDFCGTSMINPDALARMIGPFTDDVMEHFSFKGPSRITAKGVVGYQDLTLTKIDAWVESRGLAVMQFVTDKCDFTARVSGLTNVFSDIRGKIYGGDFTGSARFVLPSGPSTNTRYIIEGEVKDAELKQLAAVMTKKSDHDYQGKLSGNVKVEGLMGEGNGRTASGGGYLKIKNGRIFRFPLFGGFTDIITKIIPGLNFVLSQSHAEAEFEIGNGRCYTRQVLIEGTAFTLKGRGRYFLNGDLDFKVQLRLLKKRTLFGKLLQTIMWPLSSLFEFRLKGPIDNPTWYPINFSKELLRKLGLRNKK